MQKTQTPALAKVLAVIALVAVIGGGAWLVLSQSPGPGWLRVLFTVVFFVVVSAVIARIGDARPDLKMPLRVTFLVIAISASSFYVWDTWLRPKSERNENVATATVTASQARGGERPPQNQNVQLSAGSFEGIDGHSGSGQVSVIQLAGGGAQLVFEDFEVTQGPDLRVYLVEGDGEVSGDNFKDVGSLKAEKGQFQYEIDPADAERYPNVVVWCRAFSVGFARAPLDAS